MDSLASNVLTIVLCGGMGSRLSPLTDERAEPAVPLAGKYRMVDIPISNSINSGIHRVYLLTQFNSASLHRHISRTYQFDGFSHGFVQLLAAEQTPSDTSWYLGPADAVRKNKSHFQNQSWDYALILSGDQLYRMDFQQIVRQHRETNADLTLATTPVALPVAKGLGIMQIDAEKRITRFVEKPTDPQVLNSMKLPREWYPPLGIKGEDDVVLASMGIYVFSREVLFRMLDNNFTDFGKHIIPTAIQSYRTFSYIFQGYWEDIGTIRSFFDANIDLTAEQPRFNFFDMAAPIFTRPLFLPNSKINGATIDHSIISDGCIINDAKISNCVVGLRSFVDRGSRLNRVILMGCDDYESEIIAEHPAADIPRIGIGSNTVIENAIIDKNARIGDNCVLTPAGKPDQVTESRFFIRDGILIIPKNGIIPHGTVI